MATVETELMTSETLPQRWRRIVCAGNTRPWRSNTMSAVSEVSECHARTVTGCGEREIDQAIATLVLAFATDPVARWTYDDPSQYLRHIPRLFRAFGSDSVKAGTARRTDDGHGVALWLAPGAHMDNEPIEAAIAETIAANKQSEVGSMLEKTEMFRPIEPHWYLSLIGVEVLHRNKGYGGALLRDGLRQCDRDHRPAYLWSSNPLNIPLYMRNGFEIVGEIQTGSSPTVFPMLRRAR
jgi:ribosomal protein S18 acetylase RimI-like enzyme